MRFRCFACVFVLGNECGDQKWIGDKCASEKSEPKRAKLVVLEK